MPASCSASTPAAADDAAPRRGRSRPAPVSERRGTARALRRRRVGLGSHRACACPSSCRCQPAGRPRAAALVQRARALRALLVPLLRRADRGPQARRTVRARWPAARRARRDGDRRRRARPARGGRATEEIRERVLARYPGRDRGRPGADRGARGRVARVAAGRRLRDGRRACGPSAASRSSTTACCSTGGSTCSRSRDGRALVVDYKTNRLEEHAPAEVVEAEYRLQRLVYALAAFRAGAEEVEVTYVFLERPDEPVAATFARTELPALEAELTAAIDRIQAGDFRPTPSEFACPGCPALDVVCAGPRLLSQPECGSDSRAGRRRLRRGAEPRRLPSHRCVASHSRVKAVTFVTHRCGFRQYARA